MMRAMPPSWADLSLRRQVMERTARELTRRLCGRDFTASFRFLSRDDAPALHELSVRATRSTPAFGAVLSLDERQMDRYWRALGDTLLADQESFVVALVDGAHLLSVASLGSPAFPGAGNAICLLWHLLGGIGPAGLFRYLRAIHDYERLLSLPGHESASTIRLIWLYADPDERGRGAGTRMCTFLVELCHDLGFARIQGAVDAADVRLNRFYERLGARHGRRSRMSGIEVVETIRLLTEGTGVGPG
ncbi:MAG: GNAT family N-acetyltransferase [Candidatus Riflebacteria bacterium]|nr:GNAT family N-acetyltransferase [Candidatus Riflebacteria bacterium]